MARPILLTLTVMAVTVPSSSLLAQGAPAVQQTNYPLIIVLSAIIVLASSLAIWLHLTVRNTNTEFSQWKATQQAEAEQQKIREEQRRTLLQSIPLGIFRATPDCLLLSADQAMLSIYDYDSVEEFSRDAIERIFRDPDWHEGVIARLRKERTTITVEAKSSRKDGSEFWIISYLLPIFGENGELKFVDGAVKDVNKRKLAELRERESERRYQLLTTMSPIGIYMTDADGNCIYVNEQWSRHAGLSSMEASGSGWEKAIHPDDLEAVKQCWYQAVKARAIWEDEYRYLRPDGTSIWVWGQGRPLFGEEGQLIGYIGSNTDISRIKEAEMAISYSEAKYRAVVQSAAIGIISLNESDLILSANPAFREISGYDETALRNRQFQSLFATEEQEIYRAHFNNLINGVYKSRIQVALDLRRQDGKVRTLSITLSRPSESHTENGEQIIAIVEDITERLLLEEELSHADKLESVGLLAGGIAHDFNNMLTGIIGNLSLAETNIAAGTELHELVSEAQKSALRAQRLTQRLLTFSKGGKPVTKTMPIEEVVQEAALFALRGSKTTCEFVIEPELEYVNIDEDQIVQVVHNLVLNADQAMPKSGRILIELGNYEVVDEVEHGLKPGQYIRMDIADEGVGIPPDYLAKVFDPFFSTKDAGSGLGLSTSYSIVKKHGGHIKVESRIGRGSKFSIFLPVAKRSVKCTSSEPDRQMFEGGKILVMDDEESVRNVIRPSLQKLGFEVLEARDSSEATGIFRRIVDSGDSLVVALLDLTIPGSTGGVETLRILKSIDPDVKAIVMSGYVLDPVMQNYGNFGFCGSIRKPLGTNELREALSLVLIDANPLKST